ncbi:uncharacterized protein LOC128556564 [Mercenaria mercenaria]|uniref:uncharacterized protein LOC128556564 n=1 Tax=Mercenaria mercenaria TaxID=6596 RepID=UPI00234E8F54|nr:uncharacterized protein LOC128556564 [Mercenaria mercenaria]
MKSSYHSDLSYSRLSDHVPERRIDRERESYTLPRPSYDLKRTEPLRDDRDYKEERFTKSESRRYESFRPGPDGGSLTNYWVRSGILNPFTQKTQMHLGHLRENSLQYQNHRESNLHQGHLIEVTLTLAEDVERE